MADPELNEPAAQLEQFWLVSANIPTPHDVQEVDPEAETVPLEQAVQLVAPAKLNDPMEHVVQAELALPALNDPAVQLEHVSLVTEYCPAPQDVHEDEPDVATLPLEHAVQVLAPSALNDPAEHAVQDAPDESELK